MLNNFIVRKFHCKKYIPPSESSVTLISKVEKHTDFGIFGTAKYIYRNEGIFAFWRGNWANCVRYFPKFAFDMAFLEQLKGTLKTAINPSGSKNFGLILASKWTAGVIASVLSTTIVYPLEYVRTRLAADMGQ